MYLNTVTVEGFRASATDAFSCTFPDRFSVLLGSNNAGKTTVAMRCIWHILIDFRCCHDRRLRCLAAIHERSTLHFSSAATDRRDHLASPW